MVVPIGYLAASNKKGVQINSKVANLSDTQQTWPLPTNSTSQPKTTLSIYLFNLTETVHSFFDLGLSLATYEAQTLFGLAMSHVGHQHDTDTYDYT
jgi:hypothetical protein